jgi:threonine dehydratase
MIEEFRLAERLIRAYLPKTPLVRCYPLEEQLNYAGRLFLKCENLQWTNSFKTRGAFVALLQMSPEERKRGAISRSSGNFAQALAYAGSVLQVPITLIMPSTVPQIKKESTEKYGPRIFLTEPDYDKQFEKVQKIAETEKLTVLHPFNHPSVIRGAGTISLEIWEDVPTIAQYYCQIGGGGLMSGSSTALKALNPDIETIGVEPLGANDYFLSREEGTRVRIQKTETIADGLLAPEVGDLPWPLLQRHVDKAMTVTDRDIKHAMKFLYEKMGMIIEPSGAVSFAAMLAHPERIKPRSDIACILSGANVDRHRFFQWIKE